MLRFDVIPVTPFAQNTTLVWCSETKAAALIDPGGEVDRLLDAVKARGLSLEAVWLTHGHLDHCGGALELRERIGVPIVGPQREDAFWIDAMAQQAQWFGFGSPRGFAPDRWLEDGDTVTLGDLSFEVYHTPGHTPGHVIFFNREGNWAQVGDVLFRGSIGRTDFPRGNHAQLLTSIREKLWPLGREVAFVPGHGPMSNFGDERDDNPFVADGQR
jgi:glyoxylase-like metal-dependent hydrolase (beta-lactamase superfamily II)